MDYNFLKIASGFTHHIPNTPVVFNRPKTKYDLEGKVYDVVKGKYFKVRCYNGRLLYQLGRQVITFKQLKTKGEEL